MKRIPVDAFEKAPYLLKQLPKGALFSVADGDHYNTMTIGWGSLGIEWGQPVFIAYIRNTRYTWQLLKDTRTFTVNFPLEGAKVASILRDCGRFSGADINKFEFCGLEAVPGEKVNAPAIVQLPLTLECEIIYQQDQDPSRLPDDIRTKNYPPDEYHTAFYGRIVDCYILEK